MTTVAGVLCLLASQSVHEVWRAADGAICLTMDPRCRAVAADGKGNHFALVGEVRDAPDLARQTLRLLRSEDGGRSWTSCVSWAVGSGCEGSIAADPDGPLVHVVHATREVRADARSIVHRVWDLEATQWRGPCAVLAEARGPKHEFQACDLEIAPGGMLVATALGIIDADPLLGRNPAVVFVRREGAAAWAAAARLNRPISGGSPQIALAGASVWIGYTAWAKDRFQVNLRTLTRSGELSPAADVVATEGLDLLPANAFSLLADVDGRVRVLLAGNVAATGQLALATAAESRSAVRIDLDGPLQGGNHHYMHFGLARGPGAELVAIYSKASEAYAVLWCARSIPGAPERPSRRLASGPPGAFRVVNPYRSGRLDSTLFALASGAGDDAPQGRVVAVGLFPARVTHAQR